MINALDTLMKYEAIKDDDSDFMKSSRQQTAAQFGVSGLKTLGFGGQVSRIGKRIPGAKGALDKIRKRY